MVDRSKSFGDTAEDGWVYGSSLERIQFMIKNLSTTGEKSTTSMFRRRRWCRSVRCVSKDIVNEIEAQIGDLQSARKTVEKKIRDMHAHAEEVSSFEQKRLQLHDRAYQSTVQRITTIDASLAELAEQLRKLRQVTKSPLVFVNR